MSILAVIDATASAEQRVSHDYRHFSAVPVNGALGAEIEGIDLARDNAGSMYDELHEALARHQVLVFRDQTLEPERLVEIGRRFGELHVNPFVEGVDGFPEIMPVRSEENHEKQFTGLWHADLTWEPVPSMGSMLYAIDVPAQGGDTLFANLCLAYETLSTGMQQLLSNLSAEHRADRHHRAAADYGAIPEDGVLHPVVTEHPVTGRGILYVNEYFTTRFADMTEQESLPLLDYLFRHAARPDFTCRIRWRPGTLVFWDNRCTQHYATNDYPGQKRLMHRITIIGEAPRNKPSG